MTLAAHLPALLHPALLDQVRRYPGHALLLTGPQWVGKRALARQIAAFQNCQYAPRDPARAPCGQCASCRAAALGQHPDLLTIAPRATTGTGKVARRRLIPVGAIVSGRGSRVAGSRADEPEQDVLEFVEVQPTYRRRVVLIEEAETLVREAANALLKLVEEPPHNALFILLSEDLGAVTPTLVSRSARLNVTPLPEAVLAALPGGDDARVRALAAGRPGVLEAAATVRTALDDAEALTRAVQEGLMAALDQAAELEKRWDAQWHPQALRQVWASQPPQVRVSADAALERLNAALESYASPALVFMVLALDLRAAFGVQE